MDFIKEKNRVIPNWFKVSLPILLISGLLVIILLAGAMTFLITAWLGQPVATFGFEQTFEQPVLFPHTIHAGSEEVINSQGESVTGMGLDCTYCHRTVVNRPSAGVPSVEVCAFCHRVIGKESNTELINLREQGGFDTLVGVPTQPINWRRVHRLPDHVRFVHSAHIQYLIENPQRVNSLNPDLPIPTGSTIVASQVCSTCHGDVAGGYGENITEVTQVESLKMGQCVDCHKENGAPSDCAVCHH